MTLQRAPYDSRMGRIVSPPAHVRASLEALFGEGVDRVRVVEHSLFARLHWRATATTRHGRIYLSGSAEEFFDDPRLMLHEYFHVLGQWQPGALTVGRYLLECCRRGYWDNRFEIEAREFAEEHFLRLRALLARHREAGGASPGGSAEQRLAAIQPAGDQGERGA